ncbi:hypothetical protein [Segatella baroniae]|nr:hypothetical protein [Segatella baroniae]
MESKTAQDGIAEGQRWQDNRATFSWQTCCFQTPNALLSDSNRTAFCG